MSNLKPCKSCANEVAKSAKTCPNCGQKLKMGLLKKVAIGIVGLLLLGSLMQPSEADRQAEIKEIETAAVDGPSSSELAAMFTIMSDHTDIQRENKEKEITGTIVRWSLPVFDVTKSGKNYRIQTKSSSGSVGTFVTLTPRNDSERPYIEGLTEGDYVSFKGRITGTTMRNINVKPAVLDR